MRTLVRCIAPLLLAAASALPAAADVWERSFEISKSPDLAVRSRDGSVEVRTWDRPSIGIKVTTAGWRIAPGHVEVDAAQRGDRVDLEVRSPHWTFSFGMVHAIRIEISMPVKGALDVQTGDGSVTVDRLAGTIHVHTGDGRISVSSLKGDLALDSGDGSITGEQLEGTLAAHTADGHIRVEGRFDGLTLTSGDGSVEARAGAGSKVASGWTIRTGDGHVNLDLPRDLRADLDAHTGDGGITLDLPVAISGRITRRTVVGTINGGGPPLLIRTGDGPIRIGPI